ncbi:MAG: hypothetical protein ABIH70_08980 [Chloroflexota bacterium]
MDFSAIAERLPLLIILLAALLIYQFVFRRRRTSPSQKTTQEIVLNVLSDVKFNLKLLDALRLQHPAKELMTANWKRDKSRLQFLPQPLQDALNEAFALADDFNRQLTAGQSWSGQTAGIDQKKLKEKLLESEKGLEEWLLAKVKPKGPPPIDYPTLSESLFGGRKR